MKLERQNLAFLVSANMHISQNMDEWKQTHENGGEREGGGANGSEDGAGGGCVGGGVDWDWVGWWSSGRVA